VITVSVEVLVAREAWVLLVWLVAACPGGDLSAGGRVLGGPRLAEGHHLPTSAAAATFVIIGIRMAV